MAALAHEVERLRSTAAVLGARVRRAATARGWHEASGLVESLGGDYQRLSRRGLLDAAFASDLGWPPGTGYVLPDWRGGQLAVEYDQDGRAHGRVQWHNGGNGWSYDEITRIPAVRGYVLWVSNQYRSRSGDWDLERAGSGLTSEVGRRLMRQGDRERLTGGDQ